MSKLKWEKRNKLDRPLISSKDERERRDNDRCPLAGEISEASRVSNWQLQSDRKTGAMTECESCGARTLHTAPQATLIGRRESAAHSCSELS